MLTQLKVFKYECGSRVCVCRYFDCLKEGRKKGPFDKEEMELLQKLVEKHGVGESLSLTHSWLFLSFCLVPPEVLLSPRSLG